jgi:hypothetical protein
MADEDGIPNFTFSDDEIAAIKASVGAVDVVEGQEPFIQEDRPKRGPGRPKGSKNRVSYESTPEPSIPSLELKPAPLTKREEREVETRLVNILTGATGMASIAKPYFLMTDEEATAIAAPLASYLIRNESTNGIAREILENYDLLAMTLGVGAYSVRVYGDRKHEVESRRPTNTEAIQRISSIQESDNGRQPDEGNRPLVSVPNASRSGSAPFDI